jgi:carboxyl-terminal processing protease
MSDPYQPGPRPSSGEPPIPGQQPPAWQSEQGTTTWRPGHVGQWHQGGGSAPPEKRGSRAGMLGAIAIVVVLVFLAGLFIGQAGLLGGGATPSPTPAAQGPTPTAAGSTPTPGPTPDGTTPTPTLTPGPGATPVPIPTPGPVHTAPPDMPADFELFWEAYQIIREQYVGRDHLGDVPMTYGAIRGLVEALGDTGHSIFLTPEELAREQESLGGTIVGIGVLLGERDGRPVIVSVVSGGPASRAGLRSGDEIVQVDGQNVERLAPEQLAPLVRGEQGTTVEIRVFRPAASEFIDFSIVREEIRFPAATWTMVPGTQVALLRFIQFSQNSAAELRAARDEAIAGGARGIILDLRSNPGGLVHEAVAAASLFMPRGSTIYIRELADGERIPVSTNEDAAPTELPMVVLIDQGSASSAEIMAGGIGGAGRAPLIGETTFGTGTVLITYPLSDGSAVRIAIERWLTPAGELIFGRGIEPDIAVELDPNARPLEPDDIAALSPDEVPGIEDAQLLRALEELRNQGVP